MTKHIYDLKVARALHSIDASRWLGDGQRASWLEWAHPNELSRPFSEIVQGLEWVKWPELIKPGSACIDIGAHSGDTTIPMGLFCFDMAAGRRGTIVAVEPNPDLQDLLAACFSINSHVANFLLSPVAITEKDIDEVELSDHGNANCNGGIAEGYSETLTSRLKQSAKVTYKVRGLSIPTLLRENKINFSDVTFIKIDCEGYDKEIIRGAKDFFDAIRPALFIEWFAWFLPEDDDDLFRAIDEIGYAPYHPGTLEPLDRGGQRLSDITCLPKAKKGPRMG